MYKNYCELRDKYNKKDSDVAKATGITKSTFSDWKSGRSEPKREKLQKIADYFGVTLGYLMGVEEETPNATDENNNLIVLDDEALELMDQLRTRPEMKTLFSVSKNATSEDILKTVKIIEALKDENR